MANQCKHCNKDFKSPKYLENHINKFHPNNNVKPDTKSETKPKKTKQVKEVKAVEEVEQSDEDTITDVPKHDCNTCEKCKYKLDYLDAFISVLLSRFLKLENYTNILMIEHVKRQYIKEHNEKNPNNPITEKDIKVQTK